MSDESNPNKKGGRFGKGNPNGNPFGRPTISPEIIEIRKLNQKETVKLFNKVIWMTREELAERWADRDCPVIEGMLIKLCTEVLRTGDAQKLNLIIDRLIGKVKETVEITPPKPTVMKLIGEDAALVLGPKPEEEEE